jgi:hypothetical protein
VIITATLHTKRIAVGLVETFAPSEMIMAVTLLSEMDVEGADNILEVFSSMAPIAIDLRIGPLPF